jgi:hypothetical protein
MGGVLKIILEKGGRKRMIGKPLKWFYWYWSRIYYIEKFPTDD